jgi:hypothetical protein
MPADARTRAHARAIFEAALGQPAPPRSGTVAVATWLDAAILAAHAAAAEARAATPQEAPAIEGALDLLRGISAIVRSR